MWYARFPVIWLCGTSLHSPCGTFDLQHLQFPILQGLHMPPELTRTGWMCGHVRATGPRATGRSVSQRQASVISHHSMAIARMVHFLATRASGSILKQAYVALACAHWQLEVEGGEQHGLG